MRLALPLTLLSLVVATIIPSTAPPRAAAGVDAVSRSAVERFAPGELLVGWETNDSGTAAKARSADLEAAFDLEPLSAPGLERLGASRFRVRGGGDAAAVAARIAAVPGVRYAEPNAIVYPAAIPSDPLYGGVSGVPTDMQRWAFGGIGDNRVLDAERAWDVTTGDPEVVIAVIDSGLDLDNPELQNVWVNADETPGNGRDDDANGYVDDVNGYDFHNQRGDVTPDLGDGIDNDGNAEIDDSAPHGTIAASLIASAHDGAGIVGGAPGCPLMVVKIFGDDGGVWVSELAEAIEYATDNHADVINLSLSTLFNSQALLDATRYALDRKVVVVAAAGNGDSAALQYPASYQLVVSVGGSGSGFSLNATADRDGLGRIDGRWPSSQFGLGAVEVVAPAVVFAASVATVGYNQANPEVPVGATFYGIYEGTSFATPYVSALAGLVVSRDRAVHGRRTLLPADVLALLQRTTTDLPVDHSDHRYSGNTWDGHGRVNYAAALEAVPGAGVPNPTVDEVKFFKKRFKVIGDGFSSDSTIEINGTTIAAPVTFSYADRVAEVTGTKRELGLKRRGTNRIVVVERGVRSPEFVY
jgi:hypothetical protein